MRYLVVKCGHKDVATRELAGLKETFARISGTQILTMTNIHTHHARAHTYGHRRGHAQPQTGVLSCASLESFCDGFLLLFAAMLMSCAVLESRCVLTDHTCLLAQAQKCGAPSLRGFAISSHRCLRK